MIGPIIVVLVLITVINQIQFWMMGKRVDEVETLATRAKRRAPRDESEEPSRSHVPENRQESAARIRSVSKD